MRSRTILILLIACSMAVMPSLQAQRAPGSGEYQNLDDGMIWLYNHVSGDASPTSESAPTTTSGTGPSEYCSINPGDMEYYSRYTAYSWGVCGSQCSFEGITSWRDQTTLWLGTGDVATTGGGRCVMIDANWTTDGHIYARLDQANIDDGIGQPWKIYMEVRWEGESTHPGPNPQVIVDQECDSVQSTQGLYSAKSYLVSRCHALLDFDLRTLGNANTHPSKVCVGALIWNTETYTEGWSLPAQKPVGGVRCNTSSEGFSWG